MSRDVEVYKEFFPDEVLRDLVEEIDNSSIRKREFLLDDTPTPPPAVLRAAAFASETLGLRFNLAILKWYRLTDPEPSGAFEKHQDPPRLRSIPLVLASLTGLAELRYDDSANTEHLIRCESNTVVVLKADLPHAVSPPLGPSGERYFFFLGFDTELEPAAAS